MQIISLQVTKEELSLIDSAKDAMGFRSRSEYVRQAVVKQAKKDLDKNDNT